MSMPNIMVHTNTHGHTDIFRYRHTNTHRHTHRQTFSDSSSTKVENNYETTQKN